MGFETGSQSLKSPARQTFFASGAQQRNPTGLMFFFAEYRSGLRRKEWECMGYAFCIDAVIITLDRGADKILSISKRNFFQPSARAQAERRISRRRRSIL